MVSLTAYEREWSGLRDNPELEAIAGFIFRQNNVSIQVDGSSSSKIVRAIVSDARQDFESVVAELDHRNVTVESTWISNDVLIFFLLIGLAKYKIEMANLPAVFNARDKCVVGFEGNATKVFRELHQGNLGLHSNASFIKLVFCDLVDPKRLQTLNINSSIESLTGSPILASLSPFFRVLALRAYSIALSLRTDTSEDRLTDALTGIKSLHNKTLTDREIPRLISLFPISIWILIVSILIATFTAGGVAYSYRPTFAHLFELQQQVPIISVAIDAGLPNNLLREYAGSSNASGSKPSIVTIRLPAVSDSTRCLVLSIPTSDIDT